MVANFGTVVDLHVKMHPCLFAACDRDVNDAVVGQGNGAVCEGVRGHWHDHDARKTGVQNGTIGRQGVSCRAGWSRQNQAIGAQIVHEAPIHLDMQFNHAPHDASADDDVVQGDVLRDVFSIAQYLALKILTRFANTIALDDVDQAGVDVIQTDVGQKPQSPLVDADQRNVAVCQLARNAQKSAVAARDHGAIGVFLDFSDARKMVFFTTPAGFFRGFGQHGVANQHFATVGNQQVCDIAPDGVADGCAVFCEHCNASTLLIWHSDFPVFGVKCSLNQNPSVIHLSCMSMIDDRGRSILKTLVERYITEGSPVGSRALSKWSMLDLSPATIRNVMSDLEELRLVTSPHTSAGRVPTPLGYRMFVDSLLTVKPLTKDVETTLNEGIRQDDPSRVLSNAADLLSGLSSFAGIVTAPRRAAAFKRVEFLSLSERKVLLILVTPDDDVQNRILVTQKSYSQSELTQAGNFFNQNFSGLSFQKAKKRLAEELAQISQDISQLMQAAVNAGEESVNRPFGGMLLSGEHKLLDVADLFADMDRLKRMFGMFEQRTELLHLLESSNRAPGVQIYIGGESSLVPMEEMSVISAPYAINGEVVGTLGVIGPTRMAYERLIPMVDITAKLVSSALSDPK